MRRIGFVGLSHLGIVSSAAAAAKGYDVVAYDPEIRLDELLASGRLPVAEPGLAELFAAHRARLSCSTDPRALRDCELLVCAVDVPTDTDNHSDLSTVHRLLEILVTHAAPGTCVVILSQVSPGVTRAFDHAVQQRHAGRGLHVYYQVETLVIGQAVKRALEPERIIVGCRNPQETLAPAYAEFLSRFGCPVLPMRYESAELAKIAVNMFLVSSVCTTNTLAELCEAIGADWSEIVPALRSDTRIGPHAYLAPGLGLSGGNLERDLMTFDRLARTHGTDPSVVEAWLANSRSRREWVRKILEAEVFAGVHAPVLAMWGLAYKPGTASMKNAPSLALVQGLGNSTIRVYDPQARLDPNAVRGISIHQASSPLDAARDAEALIIMTPWPEFASADLAQVQGLMRGRVIIDPFGVLSGQRCAALGFQYFQLGVPRTESHGTPSPRPNKLGRGKPAALTAQASR